MYRYTLWSGLLLVLAACGGAARPTPTAAPAEAKLADVTDVQVSGAPNTYQFAVTVASPDTGCAQYADWWEVVRADGTLVYRRVLLHSHVDEQPFTRSGGPVEIAADEVVLVRAHMNPGGYGGAMLRGSVAAGFTQVSGDPAAPFAPELTAQPPLPDGCAF